MESCYYTYKYLGIRHNVFGTHCTSGILQHICPVLRVPFTYFHSERGTEGTLALLVYNLILDNTLNILHTVSTLELCIVYFKRCDTYHNTHEVIFDMYQQYILSDFRSKKLDISKHSQEFGLGILMTKYPNFKQKYII